MMMEQTLPRMRTAKQAAAELRRIDPDTVFREHHIRALMQTGAVTVVSSGKRKFVNLDQLIETLNKPGITDLAPKQAGAIRPIPERG